MDAQRLAEILKGNPAFETLKARLERLAPVQDALLQALPAPLHAHVRVTMLEDTRLHLQVSSQAVAARLRLQAPSLIRHLQERAPGLASFQFHVAPLPASSHPRRPATAIPPEALAQFETLAGRLPPSPLKAALQRLLQVRGRSA